MEATARQRYVLCMKWGTKYGPEYVNNLYGMVRRNLGGDFIFVCLTDDSAGIRPEVRCLPIPAMPLKPEKPGVPDRAWRKLSTFTADLHGLKGTALYLDVDVVVVGSLDGFFTQPGEFLIIKDYKRPWRVTGNSSVYRFEIGAHADVLSYFHEHEDDIRIKFRNEQAYLSDYLHGQGKLAYWPRRWCPSFKYHSIPSWPFNYWMEPSIPEDARVVIFHGECNPPDALTGQRNRRFRFIKPAGWVANYWRA